MDTVGVFERTKPLNHLVGSRVLNADFQINSSYLFLVGASNCTKPMNHLVGLRVQDDDYLKLSLASCWCFQTHQTIWLVIEF